MLTADSIANPLSPLSVHTDSLLQQSNSPGLQTEAFPGFDGIAIDSLLMSETCFFAVLLFLFLLLSFSAWLNPGFLLENFKSVGGLKKQYFGSLNLRLATSPLFLFTYLLLASSIVALYAYLLFSKGEEHIDFVIYLYFVGITLSYLFLKIFIVRVLCYVFFNKKTFSILIKTFYNLLLLLSFSLFPILVLGFYSSLLSYNLFLILGLLIFSILCIGGSVKLFQLFSGKKLDFFYILLYLCTLEILPVLLLFQVYELIT